MEDAETMGASSVAAGASGEHAGTQIDRYRLMERIGEGGMGTVWMAQQSAPLKRRVALKIIKLGMDTREVVARFEVERQALALMDHPHIAKVLDGGATASGRPYFVMELVRGDPITNFCDESKLGLGERLQLFLKVCGAIQHAHLKGIIHRDIKPTNILVSHGEGQPLPKVIDFGIAKATSGELTQGTLYTKLEQVIGTPEYMAPEQAQLNGLDVDTRIDVYSLGVLLYELLTGTRPIDVKAARQAGYEELLRTIREVDPAKPSTRISSLGESASSIAAKRHASVETLGRRLRGDLDWIVMKALEKDRTRRYETASAFADDIRRFLNHEEVSAAPPSWRYRMGKLMRRRRKTVIATGLIGVSLMAGLMGTGVGWWRTLNANAKSDAALRETEAAIREEARLLELATESERVVRLAGEEAQRETQLAQEARARATQRALELEQVAEFQSSQLSDLNVELMGRRIQEALVSLAPADRRASLAQRLLPLNFTNLALETLRENLFEHTLEAIDRQFEAQPEVQAKLLQASVDTLTDLGLLGMALEPQERAMAIRSSVLGDEHPDTLQSTHDMGYLLLIQGELEEAEPFILAALEARRRVLGPEHPATLNSINNLGYLRQLQGRFEEAEVQYQEALRLRRKVLGDENPFTLRSVNNMGYLMRAQGRLSEAEPYYREALEGRRRVLGDSDPETLVSINNMGFLLHGMGRTDEGMSLLKESLEGSRRVLGDVHPETLISVANVGGMLYEAGRYDEAKPYFLEALAGSLQVLGAEHADSQIAIRNCEGLLSMLLQGARQAGEPLDMARAQAELGAFYLERGRFEMAEEFLMVALELSFEACPEDDPLPWVAQTDLAMAIAGQGRFEDAASLLEESTEWMLENQASDALNAEPKRMARVLEQARDFHGAWEQLRPGGGHGAKAAEWQAQLSAWLAQHSTGAGR